MIRNISTNKISCVESVRSERTAIDMRTPAIEPTHIETLFLDIAVSYSEGSQRLRR